MSDVYDQREGETREERDARLKTHWAAYNKEKADEQSNARDRIAGELVTVKVKLRGARKPREFEMRTLAAQRLMSGLDGSLGAIARVDHRVGAQSFPVNAVVCVVHHAARATFADHWTPDDLREEARVRVANGITEEEVSFSDRWTL